MKTSSAKAKGRRCAQEARDALVAHGREKGLALGDFIITSSGEAGPDIKLSPLAQQAYPFAIECKNVEKLNIWEALKQAESHINDEYKYEVPLLIFTRNRANLYCSLKLEHLLALLK